MFTILCKSLFGPETSFLIILELTLLTLVAILIKTRIIGINLS